MIDLFRSLIHEGMDEVDIVNFLDDSILAQLKKNGGNLKEVEDRIIQYGRFAEQSGANVILEACSSIGELAAKIGEVVSVPVVQVDDAMAECAVRRGERIAVVATVNTTLRPTLQLLKEKADQIQKSVHLQQVLADDAYNRLINGDKEGHDRILVKILSGLAAENDIIVLAQASMSRVLTQLPEEQQNQCLVSPPLAVKRVKELM